MSSMSEFDFNSWGWHHVLSFGVFFFQHVLEGQCLYQHKKFNEKVLPNDRAGQQIGLRNEDRNNVVELKTGNY